MSINQRIKFIRKAFKLNQTEFGEQIGLKRAMSSRLEKEGGTVVEQNRKIICDRFNISRHWLETGEGEMYISDTQTDIFDSLKEELNLSDVEEKILRGYFGLDEKSRKAVTDFIVNIGRSTAQTEDNKRITERNKAHVLLDKELDAEEKDVSALDAGNKKRA
ncbi:helix-turn-helix domain-containing protein [Pectinatus frisingensis]|uniref:helix-turn-helix domain-containing protein n=1 Tax=Pectinatus frisingensis TaxID=865 RepID=UPI0018C79384|nr:helix-turn-helix transcriptional regulator [Pectinatus frisingensis]